MIDIQRLAQALSSHESCKQEWSNQKEKFKTEGKKVLRITESYLSVLFFFLMPSGQ